MSDKLTKYKFCDEHGHPLENCTEYHEMLETIGNLRAKVCELEAEVEWLRTERDRLKAALEKIHYGVCEPTIAAVVAKALASCKGEEEGDS